MIRRLLAAIALACALVCPAAAEAASRVRVEFVLMAQPTVTSGAVEGAPGLLFGAQTMSVSGSTVQSTAPAPRFGITTAGYARLTGVAGAVVCSWDGSVPSDANGVRIAAGEHAVVTVGTGQALACVESGDLPSGQTLAGSVSVSNFPGTQAVSAASLPLPSGAATAAGVAALLTAVGAPLQQGGAIAIAPYAHAVVVTPGTAVTAGRAVFLSCSAAGNVRLQLGDGVSLLDVPVQPGASEFDNIAVSGVVAAATTAACTVSVLS